MNEDVNVIIGGTHGLGSELVKLLQASGRKTFIIGRSYEKSLHGEGMRADISNLRDVDSITKYISECDSLAGFYWVAGFGYAGDFANQTDSLAMAQVNFSNVVPLAQAAWRKQLTRENTSHFIVISSTTGVKARANEAVYAATKHAQVGFTRSLGLESERLNTAIKVALFLPGGMQTPFWDGERPDSYDSFLDPKKVAVEIYQNTRNQSDYYYEQTIERGSL